MELREILELVAVERAAPQITESQLEELENVPAGEVDREKDYYERAIIENREFPYLIALASGNQELAEALGKGHDRLARLFIFVHSADEVEKRHRLLIRALRSHDVILARQTLLEEIRETQEYTLSHVIEKEGTTWYLGSRQD